ncbi:MAG: hypothetical protein J5935_00810 [Lachnospiraceae bacterium]|nr:hypothetical protein [Lachnospiraceae bacterium]
MKDKKKLSAEEKKRLKKLALGREIVPTATGAGEKILNLLIGLAAVILVFAMLYMISGIRESYDGIFRRQDEDYNLRRGDYAEIVDGYYRRHADLLTGSSIDKDLAALAAYTEAAFCYHAAKEAGQTANADLYYERMRESEAAMGQYLPEAERIREKLGIRE